MRGRGRDEARAAPGLGERRPVGSRRSANQSREDASPRRRLWPPPEGAGLASAALGLIFLAHIAYGALRIEASLIAGGADRKSTRLNSSHVVISYAVFCWKKKNTN